MTPGDFVTADTHFGHRSIIKSVGRPFGSVEEMDRELIERWNAKVPKEARVYHLGDFALCPRRRALEIFQQLNGVIYLILGNHDKVFRKLGVRHYFADGYWETNGMTLCHYPMLTWNKKHYGAWHLHGHSHGAIPQRVGCLDVGVDTHPNYEPYSYEEVAEKIRNFDIQVLSK